jgi:DNA-3-methyladenine glycosylase
MTGRVLPVRFFYRPAAEVARDLLGAVVVSRVDGIVTSGRIVETEAYLGYEDPASHAWRGRRNAQNAGIYSKPGSWYVYRSYGIHWCANLVCAPEGLGAAVLIRALEPLEGVEEMRIRRKWSGEPWKLSDGPGKLCQALGIAKAMDGVLMRLSEVVVRSGRRLPDRAVHMTPRIGITRAADWPLRFVVTK